MSQRAQPEHPQADQQRGQAVGKAGEFGRTFNKADILRAGDTEVGNQRNDRLDVLIHFLEYSTHVGALCGDDLECCQGAEDDERQVTRKPGRRLLGDAGHILREHGAPLGRETQQGRCRKSRYKCAR